MKKLLVATTITLMSLAQIAIAEFGIDTKTGKFYSKNASSDIDQEEYNELCLFISQLARNNPGQDVDIAVLCALRAIGTPTALRLIHDFEILIKEAKKDTQRIQKL